MSGINLDAWANPQNNNANSNGVKVRLLTGKKPFVLSQGPNPILFRSSDKIQDVKKRYQDLYVSDTYKLKQIKFYGTKGEMLNSDLISKHQKRIRNQVFLVVNIRFTVDGGAEQKMEFFDIKQKPKYYRQRKIDPKAAKHKFSKEKCVISLEKDKKNNVYMVCGHTINSNSMFRYLLTVFNSNDWQYQIDCPLPKCQREWDFDYCAEVACLNETEYFAFADEITLRSTSEAKACPNCGNDCEKNDHLQYYRVACGCKLGDWCWECGKKWVGGGFTYCGNNGCTTNDINLILQNCGTAVVSGGTKVPALRACPQCHKITEHASACKHMNCKGCGNNFCFICLKSAKKENGSIKWQCSTGSSSSANCGVVPNPMIK